MKSDQKRIVELLRGRTVRDRHGLPRQTYLSDGGSDENEGRQALAKELRTARFLDMGLRLTLAELFDPISEVEERRICFEYRRKGRRSNAMAEKEIAQFIWSRTRDGKKVEAAIKSATEHFGLRRARTFDIWKRWQPTLRRLNRTRPLTLADW